MSGGAASPFQCLGAERVGRTNGNGLGLAIVRAIAGVHGAAVAANARPGAWLDIQVSFPHSPPAKRSAVEHQPATCWTATSRRSTGG
jgi:K+-sensing histidine kinase KdpD